MPKFSSKLLRFSSNFPILEWISERLRKAWNGLKIFETMWKREYFNGQKWPKIEKMNFLQFFLSEMLRFSSNFPISKCPMERPRKNLSEPKLFWIRWKRDTFMVEDDPKLKKWNFFAKLFIKIALIHLKLSNFRVTKLTTKKNFKWPKNIQNIVKTRLLLWSKMTQNWKNETFCDFFIKNAPFHLKPSNFEMP